ncbi:hypothetical protein LMG29739_01641 [Paraburkholderia solisilvae]|uniref:Uncharacterized protein n=2 Tax=Paraburkholderia solisilvae TaxID=624376 RepID=A0A6J5DHS1_9BURK|nr:hypothetical protein LMG29739_01641 [Paraburkholderia solisilvae]
MDAFQHLVEDLKAAQRKQGARAVFFKAMPARPGDVLHAHRVAKGAADDQRLAAAALDTVKRGARGRGQDFGAIYAPVISIRELIDADHRRALRPGDMQRASRAMEMELPVPADIVARVKGTAK